MSIQSMFCALGSENKESGSYPGGRGKQWVKAWKKSKRKKGRGKEASTTNGGGGKR